MDERIADAIRAVVEEGTFQPEVLGRMQRNIERVDELGEELKRVEKHAADLNALLEENTEVNKDLTRELAEFRGREKDLHDAERLVHAAQIAQAADQARAETYHTAFECVFRNTSIRREIFNNETRTDPPNEYGIREETSATRSVTETTVQE